MKSPGFWRRRGGAALLLWPSALVIRLAGLLLYITQRPAKVNRPVICIGNVTAGGAGKTPLALAVAEMLVAQGRTPHFVSRGYGGRARSRPLQVAATHTAAEVGDEPLLLAKKAPCWVCSDRGRAAQAAINAGADAIIMDDGLQNFSLEKDLSLLVIDGEYGIGNGWLLPAGPLREPLNSALERVDAVILIGEDQQRLTAKIGGKRPLWQASLQPAVALDAYRRKPVVAFAGIGRPEKFFAMLERHGLTLAEKEAFADHHPFGTGDVDRLEALQQKHGAKLLTTEKDAVRLPQALRSRVRTVPVALQLADAAGFAAWLKERLA